jgi:hypothetical protein
MLGTIARSLTHPLGQSAQREMHAGQVTAAAVPLRGALGPHRGTGHVPGEAVPGAVVPDRVAHRDRNGPARRVQVAEHVVAGA